MKIISNAKFKNKSSKRTTEMEKGGVVKKKNLKERFLLLALLTVFVGPASTVHGDPLNPLNPINSFNSFNSLAPFTTKLANTINFTNTQVAEFVKNLHKAAKDKNLDFFKTALSDDVKITLTVNGLPKVLTLKLDKPQYINNLKTAFKKSNYYIANILSISVLTNKDLFFVNVMIEENVKVKNKIIRQTIQENILIKKNNNRLQIVRLDGTIINIKKYK